MQSFRIGKTLKIRWAILSGGAPEPLAGRDLTLEISSGNRVRMILPFVADGNVAVFYYQGRDQRFTGSYTVTMWENYAKEGQTVVDRCDAFALVPSSCEETRTTAADLAEGEMEIEPSELEIGVPGMSAYELYIRHNPDSELTEEEYAEAPVQAAGAALAAVEQLDKTEAAVKQAEQFREQAEQGREASEQARVTAEQARVTAEQQRTLAEQTRVTNESARQTAETGRRAAETKREENTSEAIRNCESATQKAEDEAARVRTLADNPPKIVEVDGVRYWASWNEAMGQYVVSENRADVGDAVLFSAQELNAEQRAQAQTNIGVKSAVDVVGAGDIRTIDIESEKRSDGLRNKVGVIESSSDYFYTNPILVNKGDVVLLNNTFATTNVMPIAKVSSDNLFIKAIVIGITGVHDYCAVAQGGYISLCVAKSYIKEIQAFIIPCKLAQAISEPAGGYNRKLYESYGAVYNEETGFYELNGFTDITEEEMWNIYRYFNFNDMSMFAGLYPSDGLSLKVRTNIPFRLSVQNSSSITAFKIPHKWSYLCANMRYVEKVVISKKTEDIYLCADNFIGCNYLLYGCGSLVEVEGVIDFTKYEGNLSYVFTGCPKLKSFRLKGVHNTASFINSPNINLDTFTYIIENATNTRAITITVDPMIYGYLTGTTQPAPETGGTAEEWQALVTTALEKQISFASA